MNFYLKKAASIAVLSASSVFFSDTAAAQGVGQRSERMQMDTVVLTGTQLSGTAIDSAAAREILERVPGAVGLVEADVFLDDFAQSIGDALTYTPGVFADVSAQRESRLSIRGSGLNSTFERRGLTVLRDGVPISRASGATEFQEVDPLTIDYIEVFKGANGLRYGASSLGGAVNIVTPTGRTRDETASLRLETGSFNTFRGSASLSHAGEKWDFYTGLTGLKSDGYRDHSDVNSVYSHSNLGYKFDSGIDTRFYLTALSDNFELSGSLTFDEAMNNPRANPPGVSIGPFFPGGPVVVLDAGPEGDDWDRNLDVYRLANKTVIPFESFNMEVGAWYAYRDLDHAITRFAGIIVQQEDEVGASIRLDGQTSVLGLDAGWIFGAQISSSENDARRYVNDFGRRGEQSSRSDQSAENIVSYGQIDLSLTSNLTAIAGVQYVNVIRETEDVMNGEAGENGKVTKAQFSPKIGLLWDVNDDVQIFMNANKSFEPANMSDLTAGGALDFTPLQAQKAWTVEVGSRGQKGRYSWDVAVYRSEIENEFVELPFPGFRGAVSATFNAGDTIHQGLELGFDVDLSSNEMNKNGASFVWRNAYTFNDFTFDSEPLDPFGRLNDLSLSGNKLAGIPEQIYVTELRYETDGFYTSVNMRHVPEGPWSDYANTFMVEGYTLFGLNAGFDLTETVSLFGSIENMGNKNYISNVSTVGDFSQQGGNIFTPGTGRAVYVGLKSSF